MSLVRIREPLDQPFSVYTRKNPRVSSGPVAPPPNDYLASVQGDPRNNSWPKAQVPGILEPWIRRVPDLSRVIAYLLEARELLRTVTCRAHIEKTITMLRYVSHCTLFSLTVCLTD